MATDASLRKRLLGLIDRFPDLRLAVVGDIIADQFLYGEIVRVSREAPVLVLEYRDLVHIPGGAANAANNLIDLGCRVQIFGVVGEDDAGRELEETLGRKGADVSRIVRLRSYTTPVKTRILAGAQHSTPQQIVRVDRESSLDSGFRFPMKEFRASLRDIDGVVASDYGYGAAAPALVHEFNGWVRHRGIPLVVDSRFRMTEYHEVTSITPNITELEACTGIAIDADRPLLKKVGMAVLKKQKLQHLLVTQGRFGMTLLQPRRPSVHIPIFGTEEVADVTGAGDTVIAVFTLAQAAGGTAEEAARLSNYAGGIVVTKRGTATLTREELRSAVARDLPS